MAVASVGTPALSNAAAGSVTATWAGTQPRTAGNLLVIAVMAGAVTSSTAISTPGGYTKLTEIVSTNTRTAWYWAVAAGADASPTFTSTLTGTAPGMAAIPFELSGGDTTTPIPTSGSNTTVTTTTLASGTTAGNVPSTGCLGLTAFGAFTSVAATRTWTPGASWTNVASTVAVSQRHVLIVDSLANPTSGATLTESGTFSTTPTNEANEIIVIQPAAAALTVPILIMAPMTGA